ncbi:hypothetical protein BT69DRAFT_729461 [Atractiella rhizophila]|nr:hypothetical protein BT69DRAFT_729461 [Atractiella rhizophila]
MVRFYCSWQIGVLEPGQIQLVFSEPFIDPVSRRKTLSLEGSVLVLRSPVTHPTGVQKLTAVKHPDLLRCGYHDVLIVANCGSRPQCDYLSGGDYDGDKVTVIWDREIVDAFQAHSEDALRRSASPPWKAEDYFDFDQQTVQQVLSDEKARDPQWLSKKLIEHIFQEKQFGFFSNAQTKLQYILGIDHPLAMEAGWLYEQTLDARKQGLVLKDGKYAEFKQILQRHGAGGGNMPKYHTEDLATKKRRSQTKSSQQNDQISNYPARRDDLPSFVMDDILKGCANFQSEFEQLLEKGLGTVVSTEDLDISDYWYAMERFAKNDAVLQSDLAKIRASVDSCFEEFLKISLYNKSNLRLKQEFSRISEKFTRNPATVSSSVLLTPIFGQQTIRALKASYAYILRFKRADPQKGNRFEFGGSKSSTFALEVAFRDLLCLKAEAITTEVVTARVLSPTPLVMKATPIIEPCLQAMFTKRIGESLEGRRSKRQRF